MSFSSVVRLRNFSLLSIRKHFRLPTKSTARPALYTKVVRHLSMPDVLVTPDPASVESILSWATKLQDRVSYLIVENATVHQADFSYWRDSDQAQQFRRVFEPIVLTVEFRLPELENPVRQHGVTLGQIVEREIKVPELQRASLVIRAQSYRRRLFEEIEKAKGLLLP